ncbi:MAG: hypothetical protein II135_11230 [Clostridia bacterium]|nr:hypothetical protein [Clostridia bacterium]
MRKHGPAALALALITVFLLIPFSPRHAHAVDVVETESVDVLREALQREGNVEINLNADLYYKLPTNFRWDETDENGVRAWAVIGKGAKTLNLKAHSLTVDDDFASTAVIKEETVYYAGQGEGKKYTVQSSLYVRAAVMFRVKDGAELTVNGSGGEIVMCAQLPSRSQLRVEEMIMVRDLFEVRGGRLEINGGSYQAGRSKTVSVPLSLDGHGSAEHAVTGTAINIGGGEALVTSGEFTGHGMIYGGEGKGFTSKPVIGSTGGGLRIYDCVIRAKANAAAFSVANENGVSVYCGEFRTTAAERYLCPDPAKHSAAVITGAAAPVGLPRTCIKAGDGEIIQSGAASYSPDSQGDTYIDLNASYTDGRLVWEDGKTEEHRDYVPGGGMKLHFYSAELCPFDGDAAALDAHYGVKAAEYQLFYVMRKQSDGKWKTVTPEGGVLRGLADQSVDALYDNWKEGETYRVNVKRVFEWKGSHSYVRSERSENSLTFTVKAAKTVSRIDLEAEMKEGAALGPDSVKTEAEGVLSVAARWFVDGVEKTTCVYGSGAYQAIVTLTAKEGYKFDASTEIYMSGIALAPSVSGGTGRTATAVSPVYYGVCGHESNHNGWTSDTENHYKYCSTCGKLVDSGAHQFDNGRTEGGKTVYTCGVCGYQSVRSNGKEAITEVISDMEPIIAGQPLPSPSIRPDYAKKVTIKSYTWYYGGTKVSDTSVAVNGWYSLVLNVTADDGYYFEKGAKVLNPYYSIDAVSSTDKVISTTLRTYVKETSSASVDIPKLSPDKTVGEFLDQLTVQVDASKNILIYRFDMSYDGEAFILKRSSDGKWSVDQSDKTIDQIRKLRIKPNTEYDFEMVFTSNTYYIPDENITLTAHSYEVGHTVEGGDETCRVKFRLVSDDNVIRSVDITGVTPPGLGKKGDTSFDFYDKERIDGGVAGWDTSSTFKCGGEYTFTVSIEAVYGYEFSKDATASVNGMEAQITQNGSKATVSYKFPPLAHRYGAMTVIQPGCEEDGRTERTCSVCGEKETVIIPATGHDFYRVEAVPSTCSTRGTDEHYLCHNCDKCFDKNKNEKTTDAMRLPLDGGNHEGGDLVCDENEHYVKCVCGEKLNRGAHTFGEWTITKPATEEEEGERERECSECGYSQTEATAKLQPGHEHEYAVKYNAVFHWSECSCGDTKDRTEHTFKDGKCTVCGYTEGSDLPEETKEQKPADTKEQGKPSDGGNRLTLILIIIIAAILIAAAVVITILAVKLNKKKKEEENL